MAYIGRPPSEGSFKKVDSIAAFQNNTRTVFPLTITSDLGAYELKPVSAFSLMVVKNGTPLEPDIEFSVSGGNITFTDVVTPLTTDTIWISTLGEPIKIGTPANGAVSDSKFVPGSITYDKLTQQAKDSIIGDIITFGI
jgi:hypothetical protein